MGGRGSKSASAVAQSRNAVQHEKFMSGELSTRYSKGDKFLNEMLFEGLNYWRERKSKSSAYVHADRVSADGDKMVAPRQLV